MSARRWVAVVGTASVLLLATACGDATPPSGTAVPTATVSDLPTASTSSNPPDATPGPVPTTKPTPKPTGGGGPVVDGGPVIVRGVPEPGVEAGCLLLDGYLLLGGDRDLLGKGVPVTVTGHLAHEMASFCQQGRPLVVDVVRTSG